MGLVNLETSSAKASSNCWRETEDLKSISSARLSIWPEARRVSYWQVDADKLDAPSIDFPRWHSRPA